MRRRNPNLHKRGETFYFYWDDDGKRREESLRTNNVDLANARYDERMAEIRKRRSPNELSACTLEEACKFWLERRRPKIAAGSYRSELSITQNLVRVLGPSSRLRSLASLRRVEDYQHHRLSTGIAAKTVNNEMQVLVGIFRMARLGDRVCDYKPLKTRKSDIPDALTREESRSLLQAAALATGGAVAPYAAALAWSTGMRSKEIKCLRLGDLHHHSDKPFLVVRRAATKTDAGARRVALDHIAVWALEKLHNRATLIGSVKPEHYLLPTDRARHTRSNDPLHGTGGFDATHPQSSWEGEWRQLQKAAELTHRRFHDLRHTYITRAAEAGIPIAVVQAQVGHMSREMVDHYTHISEGAQYKAAKIMEDHDPEFVQLIYSAAPNLPVRDLELSCASPPAFVFGRGIPKKGSQSNIHCRTWALRASGRSNDALENVREMVVATARDDNSRKRGQA